MQPLRAERVRSRANHREERGAGRGRSPPDGLLQNLDGLLQGCGCRVEIREVALGLRGQQLQLVLQASDGPVHPLVEEGTRHDLQTRPRTNPRAAAEALVLIYSVVPQKLWVSSVSVNRVPTV